MLKTFEKFSELYPKNKWVKLNLHDKEYLKDELFTIIHNAYSPIGGHVRIVNPDSIVEDDDLVYWDAADIDYDPEADIVIFGKKTKFGYKISGWGHDGEKNSKRELFNHVAKILKKPGYYVEISGKPAEILIKNYNVHFIDDIDEIQKLFPESKIKWFGKHPHFESGVIDGFYIRKQENLETDIEIVLGKPNI